MSVEKVVTLVSPQPTADELRTEHAAAVTAVTEAEKAWEANPTEKRWAVVEDTRRRREQLGVRLRATEEREREAAERAAAGECAKARARYHELAAYVERGHEAKLAEQADAFAAKVLELETLARSTVLATLADVLLAAQEASELARGMTLDELGIVDNGVAERERRAAHAGRLVDRARRAEPHLWGTVHRAIARRLREAGSPDRELRVKPLIDVES